MAANSEVKGGGVHEPKAQTAGSCTGFLSMKLPKSTATPLPRRDASRSQVYIPPPPQQYVAGTHLYTWVKRDKVE